MALCYSCTQTSTTIVSEVERYMNRISPRTGLLGVRMSVHCFINLFMGLLQFAVIQCRFCDLVYVICLLMS